MGSRLRHDLDRYLTRSDDFYDREAEIDDAYREDAEDDARAAEDDPVKPLDPERRARLRADLDADIAETERRNAVIRAHYSVIGRMGGKLAAERGLSQRNLERAREVYRASFPTEEARREHFRRLSALAHEGKRRKQAERLAAREGVVSTDEANEERRDER